MIVLGFNLQAAREIALVSLQDVADACGMTRQAISAYERDKVLPGSKALLAYAEVTGFSPEDLMGSPGLWLALLTVVREQREQANVESRLLKILTEKVTGKRPAWKPHPRRKSEVTK